MPEQSDAANARGQAAVTPMWIVWLVFFVIIAIILVESVGVL